MRGYSYQILRSVLAWIELLENEVLYLEGAEDLDQVAGDAAITTQIKDTRGSGNVTLRSPGALKAIDNYWSHCSRNPGRRIRFRRTLPSRQRSPRARAARTRQILSRWRP